MLGERWTLLVVRDLLPGPRRYGQLAAQLPGIATDILTSRLRTLEQHGLVVRRQESGVGRPVSYHLTDAGQQLRPIIEQLADIGARWLGAPTSSDARFDLGWALGAAAAHLHDGAVPATPLVIATSGQDYVLEPTGHRVALRYLDDPVADAAVLVGGDEPILGVITGHIPLAEADLAIEGDADAVAAWIRALTTALPASIRGDGHGLGPGDPSGAS